jgi:hypothetical protein
VIEILCLPHLHHCRWSGIVLACTIMVMWDMTLCRLIGVYECSKGAYNMQIQYWWAFIPSGLVFIIFTWMQNKVFSLNSSNMWGHLKFAYESPEPHSPNPDHHDPDHQSQTMVCITKLSCEISALLRYYTALGGNPYQCFGTTYASHQQGSRISKEWRLKLTDTIFYFETSSII